MAFAKLALVLSLASGGSVVALPQQGQPPQEEEDSYFSGTAEEIAVESIIVSREILGKPVERRTFVLNQQTEMQGKLVEGSRVTVKFHMDGETWIAELVIVRETPPRKKKH